MFKVYGTEDAADFLFMVANHVSGNPSEDGNRADITQGKLIELFAKGVTSSSAKKLRVFGKKVISEGQYSDFVKNSTAYLSARGLPTDSFSLNGIVQQDGDISSSLMQLLGREQFILANHVRSGTITDKTSSIFTAIVATGGAYTRYHPMLEDPTVRYLDSSSSAMERILSHVDFYQQSASQTTLSTNYFTSAEISQDVELTDPSNHVRNTSIVFFPLTSSGFASAAAALSWASRQSVIGTQRIAVIPIWDSLANSGIDQSCSATAGSDEAQCTADSNKNVVFEIVSALAAFDDVFCSSDNINSQYNCELVGMELKAAVSSSYFFSFEQFL